MAIEPLTNDEVLAVLEDCEMTAVPTAHISARLSAPKPYVTTHLQQLALKGVVGFNTHRGVRRWRLTTAARASRE
ncbi:hypothetical protein SAMN05443574_11678 [Haloarcula vallismortis]|uniref:Uncharacterized protein n=2 Tax=Haloarcula vallismortis TaxID=28442 RepID=M0J637_HALVA|nr:hypothetical protein [Haloarcula vallismortis]EMA04582.1 hypothetical protein C437_13585 [Haloarcula vallismortis ATCC 29715]SDX16596.1 hypothetical protein SAMN05443574_11678 [Haloarcula vallismortis]